MISYEIAKELEETILTIKDIVELENITPRQAYDNLHRIQEIINDPTSKYNERSKVN